MFNKEIYKIKLALTTKCNLNCPYCFVKKTGERMPWEIARKSVDLLLNSPGREKLLALYGGEPFLEAELIARLAKYARARARKKEKLLSISMATNLTILNQKIVSAIRKNNIRITVSLVGVRRVHDKFRHSVNGKGTFNIVLKNLKTLAAKMPEKNLGVSFVVFPFTSDKMLENFNVARETTKIKNINFEIVQEFEKWKEKDRINFRKNYREIILDLMEKIAKGKDAYYINTISWEAAKGMISEKNSACCPFKYSLEVYPSGEMAFSPFLLNRKDKKKFIVGKIGSGFFGGLDKCVFNKGDAVCWNCEVKYYSREKDPYQTREVKRDYDQLSYKAAKYIKSKAATDKNFAKYLGEARKCRCF